MSSSSRKSLAGFTIIEVLIVLAIAGLILIIIFLAVPALQRNSRNTQRKHDMSLMAATITNFKTNHGNLIPNNIRNEVGNATIVDIANSVNNANMEAVDLGFYNGSGTPDTSWGPKADMVFIDPSSPVSALEAPNVVSSSAPGARNHNKIDTESVAIIPGETCNATGTGYGTLQANSIAVFYVLESGTGSDNLVCVDA